MKNKELFDRTVSILVEAYRDNTLKHGKPWACAVGNLIVANCNYERNECGGVKEIELNDWHLELCCNSPGEIRRPSEYVKEQIKNTGYTIPQILRIERAFESSGHKQLQTSDEKMFHSLMMVVDCLMKIHQANVEETESAKLLFVKD